MRVGLRRPLAKEADFSRRGRPKKDARLKHSGLTRVFFFAIINADPPPKGLFKPKI